MLTGKVKTYLVGNKELLKIEEHKIQKILPNQVKMDKEYKGYSIYRHNNKKKLMKNYYSGKSRDKKGLVKLTKEQFMEMYRRDKLIVNN